MANNKHNHETGNRCQIKSPDFKHDCEKSEGHFGPCQCIKRVEVTDGFRTKFLWKQKEQGSVIWYVDSVAVPDPPQEDDGGGSDLDIDPAPEDCGGVVVAGEPIVDAVPDAPVAPLVVA